ADLDRVALDLHAPPAAVAELAARHVAVEPLAVELEARGQALDDRHEPGPVRLPRGCEAERHAAEKASRTRARPGTPRLAGRLLLSPAPPRGGSAPAAHSPLTTRSLTTT